MLRTMALAALMAALGTLWPASLSESLAGVGLRLVMGGGPRGSAMTHAASALAVLLSRRIEGLEVTTEATAGSRANLQGLRRGELALAIVHAGDVRLAPARRDGLPDHERANAVAGLYQAPAQLVVPAGSGIRQARELLGKRVCVGGQESSTAALAERLFSALGLWDSMTRLYLGHEDAVEAMRQGRADAIFLLDGLPSMHLAELASQEGLRILDLHAAARESGFHALHPGYTAATIPAGTYPGQDNAVQTLADTAWLCAAEDVPAQVVRDCLAALAAEDGLEYLASVVETAGPVAEMSQGGHALPLHPGVIRGKQALMSAGDGPR